MTGPGDSLTVLRSRSLRLAKRLHPDGRAEGYDRAKHLDGYTISVADLSGLLALLRRLLARPACCVVRGELVDAATAHGIRRLLHICKTTGDAPTFRDVPRCWLALDIEGVPLPPGLPASDLAACADTALASFPVAFTAAARIVQASASHGFKPDLRLRVWVWLDRPTWGHELKRWLRGTPADPSVFGAVQPIYTAAPVLTPPMTDPVPQRLLFLPGHPTVPVPSPGALAPSCPHVLPIKSARPDHANAYVRAALTRAAARLGSTAPGGRHVAIIAETCALARLVEAGLLTGAEVANAMHAAAKQAGKDDEAEVDACIQWGLANPRTTAPVPETRYGQ